MDSSESYQINQISFNQDSSCFAFSTENGFHVCCSFPFIPALQRDLQGGIGIIEILYQSNIFALVGGGKNPKQSLNKVILWDDDQKNCLGEMGFKSNVTNVKLRSNRIVVVLDNHIFVHNFVDLKIIDRIQTCNNSKGLCSLNTEGDQTIIACPDKTFGGVIIKFYDENNRQVNVKAHQSVLGALELNKSGSKLATASEKGTLIRIFSTLDGSTLQELRRGTDYAEIGCLAFSPNGRWIACASENQTIHVFNLTQIDSFVDGSNWEERQQPLVNEETSKNPKGKFGFLKIVSNYFDSEWSFAQFKIKDLKKKIAFHSTDPVLAIVTNEGNYYEAKFDEEKGGEMTKISECRLFTKKI